jgi:hypothetical protein
VTEPDVALTDYGLAIECALFAALTYSRGIPERGLREWFTVFFASASAAPLVGGTVHGFFVDEQTLGYTILWPMSLLCIGVTAFAGWTIGARLLFSKPVARWISIAAAFELVVYVLLVLLVTEDFWIAILDYLPAGLFMLVGFLLAYRRVRVRRLRLAAVGLALSLVAALIQQMRIVLHPVYFNHNALYHLVQAAALLLIFLGAQWLVLAHVPLGRPDGPR